MALPRQQRLARGALIAALARTPPSAQNTFCTIHTQRISEPVQQCVVVVPKRVAVSAVQRNGLRRKIVAALAKFLPRTHNGWRGMIVVRRNHIPEGALLEGAIFELLSKSGIVQK